MHIIIYIVYRISQDKNTPCLVTRWVLTISSLKKNSFYTIEIAFNVQNETKIQLKQKRTGRGCRMRRMQCMLNSCVSTAVKYEETDIGLVFTSDFQFPEQCNEICAFHVVDDHHVVPDQNCIKHCIALINFLLLTI